MEFGYFTLSDNHYENNPRDANTFVADIAAEAVYADQIGMHSAWIGEHHFNSLGVLSSPELVLANVAAGAEPEAALLQLAVLAWFEGGVAAYDQGQRDARRPRAVG